MSFQMRPIWVGTEKTEGIFPPSSLCSLYFLRKVCCLMRKAEWGDLVLISEISLIR